MGSKKKKKRGRLKEDSSIVGPSNWMTVVPMAGNEKAGENIF